jgi:signal transduction histidine kinase
VRYWAPARGCYVNAEGESAGATMAGETQVTFVTRHGQPVAALAHSEAVNGERLDRALGAALRLALENEQLRAAALAELRELQLSRSRIVERAQLERRRLERNLHDGAQQRVVSLALRVRMLGQRLNGDGQRGLAARAEALTRATVEELRRVARGIYPAVLADAGLSGAILDLAESSTDLPVSLDTLPPGQYTGPVETTAYLVIAAAIAEARRRDATQVSVSGNEHDARLVIDIRDDAASGRRPGVTELADQVHALAGELVVEPESSGTRVRLELPCGS